MSDAVKPSDILNAKKVFLFSPSEELVDNLLVQDSSGKAYYLISFIGEDSQAGEEFFVLHRENANDLDSIKGGVWKDVDMDKTEVKTVYKNRTGECYREFQEFHSAKLSLYEEELLITRKLDDFGIEKMYLSISQVQLVGSPSLGRYDSERLTSPWSSADITRWDG